MNKLTLLSYSIILLTVFNITSTWTKPALEKQSDKAPAIAEWSFLTYIAADNNLAPYASYNINDMTKGAATGTSSNILVQWDQPSNKKTFRYRVTPSGKIDAGSISTEMGYNPANELVAAVQWMVSKYPAKKYAIVLWNHGSGIEDFSPGSRGILYDDAQRTCLTNAGLVAALTKIKQMLGKKLDLMAMDACLMAMVEVAYQMKDTVEMFVASEQTIPGEGFPYSKFLKPLTTNPATTTALQLAQNMVTGYQQFYTNQMPTSDFTLSAINLSLIDGVKQNIQQFITAVNACARADSIATKNLILNARNSAKSFEMAEYIDLYSFYAGILAQRKLARPKSDLILNHKKENKPNQKASSAYQTALDALYTIVLDGLTKINAAVVQNATGPVYAGVKGLAIYYPKAGSIDNTYKVTKFAKDTAWMNFIQTYKNIKDN